VTEKVIPPTAPSLPEGPQLAFLKEGDIWLLDSPEGQPYQLTFAGDLVSFAWSPDGERLAAFNGNGLCFFQRDGSIRTACLELGLDDEQSTIARQIVWSPQQNWVVLWNPDNPWDENAIGWLVVALDTTNAMWRIQDPVDWGATLAPNNEPGGVTGQPLFLPDGRLIGTLTHRYLCASGGCRYQLFEFDLHSLSPSFTAFPNHPEEGWSEGMNLLLSPDGVTLTNYGAFLFACDSYHTYIDRYDLAAGKRATFALDQQAVVGLDFSPDQSLAVLARTAGCNEPEQPAWNQSCGLSQGFETLAMQLWQVKADKPTDLPAGLAPAWSPDGDWIVFNSCLKENSSDDWETDPSGSASIYLTRPDGTVMLVSEGSDPAWRPR
jgi:WD40 repeat protein